ncbi:MAG: ribosome biogenesis GTPase Der [Bdellovibrionaceae bacterium]|nr:ribosome biogenesis GTPase Der [Pseudobdellovibrionaceae bacterium]
MNAKSTDNKCIPKVAIIGRPNVGKSTLFNILTDTRKAVVKDRPGVTRDLNIQTTEIWGKHYDLIDTGGITESKDVFSRLIREQVSAFLDTVDFVIAVMDGRSGLVPEDRDIIRLAKEAGHPFLLVINKVDSIHDEENAKLDFYEFGVDLVVASFEQRRGISDILEWLHKNLPATTQEVVERVRIAIVGKPNVGKSSLCNKILGQERVLVSDVAGTTTDSIDMPFEYQGKSYLLIDTAGLRRSSRREDDVEILSAIKSMEALRRADIVLLTLDGHIGPTEQDAKILEAILEVHKAVILVINKSDSASQIVPEYRQTVRNQIANQFHFFPDIPLVFTSAKTGYGLDELFSNIVDINNKMHKRIPTGELNDFFFETIRKAPAPVWGTTNVKFYYLTQTQQVPPAFIAFANHPDGVTPAYRRFLIRHIKERFDLSGLPIRIFCMKSRRGGENG